MPIPPQFGSFQQLTFKLIHPEIYTESDYTTILLIDNQVNDYQKFISSVNSKTFPIVYSSRSSKNEIESLLSSFTNINRIGICNKSNLVKTPNFLDNEPFFIDNENSPYSSNVEFLIKMIKQLNVKNLDFFACETLNYSNWLSYYNILNIETGVIIGASNDKTGNIKYGGDWIMESTLENIEYIYFTQSIQYYTYLLDSPPLWVSVSMNFDNDFPTLNGHIVKIYYDIDIANCPIMYASNVNNPSYIKNIKILIDSGPLINLLLSETLVYFQSTRQFSKTNPNDYIDIMNSSIFGFIDYPGNAIDKYGNLLISSPISMIQFFNATLDITPFMPNLITISSLGINSWATSFSLIDPSCYNKGTKIRTLKDYEQIENLKAGDLVMIYPDGYKAIKYIGKKTLRNDPKNSKTMYIMKKTELNNLIEDLIVTGDHFIEDIRTRSTVKLYIDGKKLIPANKSKLFTKIEDNENYTYYHLVLENDQDKHFCIWANGVISESTSMEHFLSCNFELIE